MRRTIRIRPSGSWRPPVIAARANRRILSIIDDLNGQLFRELRSYMKTSPWPSRSAAMMEDPKTVTRSIRLLFVSKYFERIADHATNIAEMVVFMVKGKSIRHLDRVPPSV